MEPQSVAPSEAVRTSVLPHTVRLVRELWGLQKTTWDTPMIMLGLGTAFRIAGAPRKDGNPSPITFKD